MKKWDFLEKTPKIVIKKGKSTLGGKAKITFVQVSFKPEDDLQAALPFLKEKSEEGCILELKYKEGKKSFYF